MRWIKSQFAVLRWSQILRCAMLCFSRCGIRWNEIICGAVVSWVIFSKVPLMKPLPVVDRSKPNCDIMRDWASAYEAAVGQRRVLINKGQNYWALSVYLNSAIGELFPAFEFSFMVLHGRLIHGVDTAEACYLKQRAMILFAWRLGNDCMYRVPTHPYVQVAPMCKSPLYVNRPYM